MDVLKIILGIACVIYLIRKDIFIQKLSFKAGFKGIEIDVSTKEKNCPPAKKDSSNH